MNEAQQLLTQLEDDMAQHREDAQLLGTIAKAAAGCSSPQEIARVILEANNHNLEESQAYLLALRQRLGDIVTTWFAATRLEYLEQQGVKNGRT